MKVQDEAASTDIKVAASYQDLAMIIDEQIFNVDK